MALIFFQVIGIEMNASAVSDAYRNAEINGIKNCKFVCAKVSLQFVSLTWFPFVNLTKKSQERNPFPFMVLLGVVWFFESWIPMKI